MNKQEILAEISELKEKLNNLEKQYEALISSNKRLLDMPVLSNCSILHQQL